MKTGLICLMLVLLASVASAQDRFSPLPLQLIEERLSDHDRQIEDINARLDFLEETRPKSVDQPKPQEVRIVIEHTQPKTLVSEPLVVKKPTVVRRATTTPVVARSAASRWKSAAEIKQAIQTNRTSRVYGRMARGAEGQVWNHLIREHGYAPSQVNGLTIDDALMLHNLAHGPKISPYASTVTTSAVAMPVDVFIPTPNPKPPTMWSPPVNVGGNCANGQCARQSSGGGSRWYFGKLLGR